MGKWKAGDVVKIDYPFYRSTYVDPDEDGLCEYKTWVPGCEYVQVGPEGETDAVYDGMGRQILTVVDVHKPGKYPERVFYTIKWVSPDSKEFGKNKLRILVASAFTRRTRGFMSHDPFLKYRLRREAA